jgi:hypothetical protein
VNEFSCYFQTNYLIKVITMNDFQRDVLLGLMFIAGIFGFISGEFIVSTILFASAAIYSNIAIRKQPI